MQNRIEIERAILGAIIYCDAYAQIAHILTPKNFTSVPGVRHRELFEATARLFPNKPIDLLTVTQEVRTSADPDGTLDALLSCGNVVSSINVPRWAMMLLQIDISEKYKAQLVDWKIRREQSFQHAESGALLEVIETLSADEDIFEIIEKSIAYFRQMKMDLEFDQATEFYDAIILKAKQINRLSSLNTCIRNLFAITECTNSQVKHECEVFAKAIADMITTGQTNERYTNAANLIYN